MRYGNPKNSAGLLVETVPQPTYPQLAKGSKGDAVKKLQEALKNAKSDKEIDLAKAKLLRAISRISVAEK